MKTEFLRRLIQGEEQTPEQWNEHLVESHKAAPAMTPLAFANCRTIEGDTSYEVLASKLRDKDHRVLDLACGNGHLMSYLGEREMVGVDMSEEELALARQAFPNATFLCESVQSMSLPDESVDTILCHMAFMLMLPIEPAVKQILRVLKSGGQFAAVVGNKERSSGLLQQIEKKITDFFQAEFPQMGTPQTGDLRANTADGWRELFMLPIKSRDFAVEVDITPAQIWDFVGNMYLIGLLPPEKTAPLQKSLVDFLKAHQNARGRVKFTFPMRLLSCIK